MPTMLHIIEESFAKLGCGLDGALTEGKFDDYIIYNNVVHEATSDNQPNQPYRPDTYDLSNHAPDMELKDMVACLFGSRGIVFEKCGETIQTRYVSDILNTKRDDWTKYSSDYSCTGKESEGYTIPEKRDDNDNCMEEGQLETVTIGEGEKDIELTLGTLPMKENLNNVYTQPLTADYWLTACTNQVGTSPVWGTSEDFCFRVLQYGGMQPDSSGNLYPFATSLTDNYDGVRLFPCSTQLAGDDGVYENFLKEMYNIRCNTDSLAMQLPICTHDLIKELRFLEPRKRVCTSTGVANVVIEEIKITMTCDYVEPPTFSFRIEC